MATLTRDGAGEWQIALASGLRTKAQTGLLWAKEDPRTVSEEFIIGETDEQLGAIMLGWT